LRELEGATAGEEMDTVVLLATLSRFTEGARRVVLGCERAMGVIVINGYEDGGQVTQFIWNAAAGRLLGSEMGVKTIFDPTANEVGVIPSRIVLTWNGNIIKTKRNIPGAI